LLRLTHRRRPGLFVVCAATRVTSLLGRLNALYYSVTVLAGDNGRDHARDYEQPPTGVCSKEGRVSIKVPDAAPITLMNSHTRAILLQVRYVVANVDGTPAWVLIWIQWLLPERAWDALVLAIA